MALSRNSNNIPQAMMLLVLCAILMGAQCRSMLYASPSLPTLLAQANNEDVDKTYKDTHIDPKPFDREVWNKKKEGLNYKKDVAEKPEEVDKQEVEKNNNQQYEPSDRELKLNLGPLGQIILIVSVMGLLALIVFVLVKLGFLDTNTKIAQATQGPVLLNQIEDNLHESDLEKALRLALDAKDYRMAIRLYYLSIIKELSMRNWIKWKRDKTNGQYVSEMMEKPEGNTFRQLTIAFERTWYGDEDIALKHFELLSPQFQNFINSLKKR